MSEPILSAQDLHKSYDLGRRLIEVLHGVSLEIGEGEFLSLQGASGTGKSTLLHLLGGLDDPTSGEVLASGQSLSAMSSTRLAKWRNDEVGFVFQSYHLLPEFDALENVLLPARMAHANRSESQKRAESLLERVGLAKRMSHLPAELSARTNSVVALARALINWPTSRRRANRQSRLKNRRRSARPPLRTAVRGQPHDDHRHTRRQGGQGARRTVQLVDGLIATQRLAKRIKIDSRKSPLPGQGEGQGEGRSARFCYEKTDDDHRPELELSIPSSALRAPSPHGRRNRSPALGQARAVIRISLETENSPQSLASDSSSRP